VGSHAIAEGIALVSATLSRGSIGAYQLQAAIAASTTRRRAAEDTDWPQILALYGLLKRMSDNPMVTLNHAIAAAMVNGARRARAAEAARRRRAHGRPLSARRRARAPARDGRRRKRAIAHYRAAAAGRRACRNGITWPLKPHGLRGEQHEDRHRRDFVKHKVAPEHRAIVTRCAR
jgi:predicted RNA polymerase sigma factor